jgi:hypothetical protein
MIRSSSARVLALALALGIGSLGLAACGNGGSDDADVVSKAPAGSTPGEGMGGATLADFRPSLDLKEFMNHVMDYNAFEVWHRQGWIIGDTVQELFPTDDDGWIAAENAARTLAEASNLLLLPGRPQDDDRAWVDFAHQLNDAAMKAGDMAEKRDKDAFFSAGTDMYRACHGCHVRYIVGADGPPAAADPLKPLPNRGEPPLPNQ